jgi:uncharacterized membrane protein (GlpM family)
VIGCSGTEDRAPQSDEELVPARYRLPAVRWLITAAAVTSDKIMMEYIIRFLVGGIAVSLFSTMGDVLRPKSFAGLLGAAPSIAVATLALTISAKGVGDAESEARSMMLGAVALCLYSASVCHLTSHRHMPAMLATALMLPVWLGCAFALKWLLGGGA